MRFTPSGGKPGYYDEQGRSLKRFLLASPLKFTSETGGHLIANNLFVVDSRDDIPLVKSAFPLGLNEFRNNLYWRTGGRARFEVPGNKRAGLGEFLQLDNSWGENEIIDLVWEMRSLTSDDLDALTLPVQGLEENGVSYVVASEPDASQALAAFREGEPLTAAIEGSGRVAVQNGNGTSGSAAVVADQLRAGGWEVVSVGNSGREDYATTVVVARARDLSRAEAVVAFLGYGRVEQGPVPRDTDVVVIVGADVLDG